MMTYKEVVRVLGWHIRSGNGFYCEGKKFTGINSNKDGSIIDLNNFGKNYYILGAKVERIESIVVDDKVMKNVIISDGYNIGC